jgi:hypothetical protein
MKRKRTNAMAKFLVPLTVFLSASLGDAFVNHARLNHLIQFQQPMSNPTNEPSRKPIREPTNDLMNDQTTHGMKGQTGVPLQQSCTHANVSQQLVLAANSKGAKVASKTAHQLSTSSHSTKNLWQCQSFVDNMSINSWQCQIEMDKVKSMKTAQRAIGSKCKSCQSHGHCYDKKSKRVGNSASTQFVGSCHDIKSEQVGNSASTQLVGSCHDNKSQQVGNRASTQLVGFCHDNKSEQVGNRASTQLVGSSHDKKIRASWKPCFHSTRGLLPR